MTEQGAMPTKQQSLNIRDIVRLRRSMYKMTNSFYFAYCKTCRYDYKLNCEVGDYLVPVRTIGVVDWVYEYQDATEFGVRLFNKYDCEVHGN